MNAKHHPSESTLIAYGAGALDPILGVVVKVHLDLCARCREEAAFTDELGGAMLESLYPGTMPATTLQRCLQNVMTRIDEPSAPIDAQQQRPAALGSLTLAELLQAPVEAIRWQRMTAGIEHFPLPGTGRSNNWLRLFRFQPGVRLPSHGHRDSEFSVVLQGAYRDGEREFFVGDFAESDENIRHKPLVIGDQPCIALIASNHRLLFDNPLYRAAARLLRI